MHVAPCDLVVALMPNPAEVEGEATGWGLIVGRRVPDRRPPAAVANRGGVWKTMRST